MPYPRRMVSISAAWSRDSTVHRGTKHLPSDHESPLSPSGVRGRTSVRCPPNLFGVEFGITLPGAGPLATSDALMAVATLAESLGFASVWVTDHIAIPEQSHSLYPYSADRKAPWPPNIPYLDALTALGWVGAVARTIRLGTSVLILPLRAPLAVAKAVGTLDHLTVGRGF